MIKLEHVCKTFEINGKTVEAVKDVSLEIREGEIFGIIGFSGAGKSTLVRCINLLEKPESGRVLIGTEDITDYQGAKLRQVRQKIGMIFQHFNLMPSRTVFENIELPLKLTALSKQERAQKINALLDLVGLTDKAQSYPSQLSGGQKQRVAIARALANDPKVLLCDEATSALDPQTTHSILQLLKEVNSRLGLTIVVITHQMEVIKEICDRVAVMQTGSVVEEGNIVDVFSAPQAPITKSFIQAADNFEAFSDLIKLNSAITGIKPDQPVWFLTYRGAVAGEPLMSELYRRFEVKANIIYGNIDYFKECIVGKLGVAIEGEASRVEAAKNFLVEQKVIVEVLR
jgi:D-methionine transport system ATP-binding protein